MNLESEVHGTFSSNTQSSLSDVVKLTFFLLVILDS
jgi:hypothetical protein